MYNDFLFLFFGHAAFFFASQGLVLFLDKKDTTIGI